MGACSALLRPADLPLPLPLLPLPLPPLSHTFCRPAPSPAAANHRAAAMRGSLDASTKQLLGEWFRAVLQTPQTFRRIAFRRRTLAEELQEVCGGVQRRQPA